MTKPNGKRGIEVSTKQSRQPEITFFMLAYNSEKYVEATIKSVLQQSENNWQFVICNNGSTDNTGKICQRYAKKDRRIVYFANTENMKTDAGALYPERAFWPTFDGKYIAMLDSDDLLDKNFAHLMLRSAKASQADMVVCGANMFEDESGRILSQRIPPALQVMDMQDISAKFPDLYGSLRPIWGKIFRRDFFEQYYDFAWSKPKWMHNGMDTYTILGYLEKCKALVSLNQPLYHYRMRQNSLFFAAQVDPIRIKAGEVLYQRGMHCIEHLNIATNQNKQYLQSVYWGHMVDLLRLLPNAQKMTELDKLQFIENILREDHIAQLYGVKENFTAMAQEIDTVLQKSLTDENYSASYLYRLQYAKSQQKESQHLLAFSIFLSAICDAKNPHNWGAFYLQEPWTRLSNGEKKFQQLPRDEQIKWLHNPAGLRNYLRQYANENYLEQQKQQLFQALEQNDWPKVLEVLNAIAIEAPLDREGLYFRILLAYQTNDLVYAQMLADMALVFWAEDEDIQTICQDLYASVKERE